jgi:hypothetical protein
MLANIKDLPHSPAIRGYRVAYRENQVNHCPSCGRSHWYIGRLLAECGFCGTAVPLAVASIQAAAGGHSRNRKPYVPTELAA